MSIVQQVVCIMTSVLQNNNKDESQITNKNHHLSYQEFADIFFRLFSFQRIICQQHSVGRHGDAGQKKTR